MDHLLVLTSCSFIIVAIYAAKARLRLYSYAWFMLCFTSIIVHACNTGRVLDKVSIYTVVALGLYHYSKGNQDKKIIQAIPVLCFVMCAYGYYALPDVMHHAWVHLFSVIGHIAIIYNRKNM